MRLDQRWLNRTGTAVDPAFRAKARLLARLLLDCKLDRLYTLPTIQPLHVLIPDLYGTGRRRIDDEQAVLLEEAPGTSLASFRRLREPTPLPPIDPTSIGVCKYTPDNPAAPRQPRLNQKRRLLHLDLMSVQSAALAGKAHEKFDLAVNQETFEHIRFPYRAATALYHLLRPGGMVLWTAPFSTRFHLIPGDYFRYSFDGARALFVDAGFRIAGLAKFGDSAMSSGYNLGFGSADFTSRRT